MASDRPKRGPGRPPKPLDADQTFEVTIPMHHFKYLEYLALKRRQLGISPKLVAEHILIRELDSMERSGYHKMKIPKA